ncbi:ninein-like protein isoform X3 [Gouania willdenowi]|uniref:ninein-like protein isoform X3 n=1 Tax=Gouania willdenowi TaxID=441366 RepID=UPI0010561382|nr:ninein-like isoform X3 [Gouania willdenowi]
MEDEYEAQLRCEFESCDSALSGLLNRDDLKNLCRKLQLDTHTHTLVYTLLQEHTQVSFLDFKDALVSALSCSLDFSDDSSYFDPVGPQEVEPKCVNGGKRYGRRSQPDGQRRSESSESSSSVGGGDSSPAKVPRSSSVDSVESLKSDEDVAPTTPPQRSGDGDEDEDEGRDERQDVSDLDGPISIHGPAPFSCSTPFRKDHLHTAQTGFSPGPGPAPMSMVGLKVLSQLDDGSGFTAPDQVLCVWTEEGIRDGAQILQSLDFPLDERVHLAELTLALDNELLVGGSPAHQAALVSYRTEIRHLLDVSGSACRQRDKLKADLDQAEVRNQQLIKELDERQTSMETLNQSRMRELEQDYRDRLRAQRCWAEQDGEELLKEAELQSHSLRVELTVLREKEAELQGELSNTAQECVRLQDEVLSMKEQLRHTQETGRKLQQELQQFDSVDPAEAALSHERFSEIIKDYELQCRELRDRNDELTSELELLRAQRKRHTTTTQLLHTTESDPDKSKMKRSSSPSSKILQSSDTTGISIHTELLVEQLEQKHKEELQQLNITLETQVNYYERTLERMRQSMEVERKEISQAFKMEISELEEQKCDSDLQVKRLKETVEKLQKELQKSSSSSSSLSSEQERRLQRERSDLEQSFAVELSHLVQTLSADKEQLEAELQLRMNQEVLLVRERLVQGGRVSITEEELQCVMEERRSYAQLCSQLSSQILEMEEELTSLRATQEEREELRHHLLQLEQLVLQLEEEEPCRTQLEEMRGENSALQERLRLLQQEVQRLEEELHSRSARLEELQREHRSISEEEERLHTENLRYREEVLTLSSRNMELSARLHGDQQELQESLVEQREMVKQLQEAKLQREVELKEQLRLQSQLEVELQSVNSKLGKLEEKNTLQRDAEDKQHKLCRQSQLEAELQRVNSKLGKLEEEKNTLQRDAEDKQHKVDSLQLSLNAVEKEAELLQLKLQSVNQDKLSHTHQLVALQEKLHETEREVQKVMQQNLQIRRSEDQNQLLLRLQTEQRRSQRLEEELQQQNLKQGEYEKAASALHQRTEELESELKAVRSVLLERVQELREELANSAAMSSQLKALMEDNSALLGALQQTEQRQKEAERRMFSLKDKNVALQRLLTDVVHAALEP